LNYPNNPTGATAGIDFLARAVEFARRYNLLLCHDAPYCDVTYDGYVAPSILQIPGASEVAVEFNSLSKTCNMAGWRVGMALGNAEALAALAQLKSNVDSGIFRPIQEAAAHALRLEPHWIAERNLIYRERVELVLEGLEACGLEAGRPRATLYLWARIPDSQLVLRHSGDEAGARAATDPHLSASEVFAGAVLNATGVALAPGSFFGPGGEGYVRVSVTAPTSQIRDAMDRLRRYLAGA
jgi:LL-diaminopimelate aminotransferase